MLHFSPALFFVIVVGLIIISNLLSDLLSLPTNLFRPRGPMFILRYMMVVVLLLLLFLMMTMLRKRDLNLDGN